MPRWVEAASLDDLPAGSALEFLHEGRAYALFRVGESISCLAGLCPHQGGRLARGPVDGTTVTCPRLGCLRWRFDVLSGDCSINPSLRRTTYPTRVEGRAILVLLPVR